MFDVPGLIDESFFFHGKNRNRKSGQTYVYILSTSGYSYLISRGKREFLVRLYVSKSEERRSMTDSRIRHRQKRMMRPADRLDGTSKRKTRVHKGYWERGYKLLHRKEVQKFSDVKSKKEVRISRGSVFVSLSTLTSFPLLLLEPDFSNLYSRKCARSIR